MLNISLLFTSQSHEGTINIVIFIFEGTRLAQSYSESDSDWSFFWWISDVNTMSTQCQQSSCLEMSKLLKTVAKMMLHRSVFQTFQPGGKTWKIPLRSLDSAPHFAMRPFSHTATSTVDYCFNIFLIIIWVTKFLLMHTTWEKQNGR